MNDNKKWFLQNEDGEYLTLRLIYAEGQEFAMRFDEKQSANDFILNNIPDDGLIAVYEEMEQ